MIFLTVGILADLAPEPESGTGGSMGVVAAVAVIAVVLVIIGVLVRRRNGPG